MISTVSDSQRYDRISLRKRVTNQETQDQIEAEKKVTKNATLEKKAAGGTTEIVTVAPRTGAT